MRHEDFRIGIEFSCGGLRVALHWSGKVIRNRIQGMHARKVQMKNGRLVLDDPTDSPDIADVEVVVIDDELSAEERAELHASLDRALDDSEAGRGMDAWEYLERYRAGRDARSARRRRTAARRVRWRPRPRRRTRDPAGGRRR